VSAPLALPELARVAMPGVSWQWSQPLRTWVPDLMRALQREPVIVRIVLATVRGSAPREC